MKLNNDQTDTIKVMDNVQMADEELIELDKAINSENVIVDTTSSKNDAETFFKVIARKLFGKKDISLKTEYLTVSENFAGVKLAWLSKYGNIVGLKDFMEHWEIKRVSLKRAGRTEMVTSMQERKQELEAERMRQIQNNINSMNFQQ